MSKDSDTGVCMAQYPNQRYLDTKQTADNPFPGMYRLLSYNGNLFFSKECGKGDYMTHSGRCGLNECCWMSSTTCQVVDLYTYSLYI
jgi:hypothetical protein